MGGTGLLNTTTRPDPYRVLGAIVPTLIVGGLVVFGLNTLSYAVGLQFMLAALMQFIGVGVALATVGAILWATNHTRYAVFTSVCAATLLMGAVDVLFISPTAVNPRYGILIGLLSLSTALMVQYGVLDPNTQHPDRI